MCVRIIVWSTLFNIGKFLKPEFQQLPACVDLLLLASIYGGDINNIDSNSLAAGALLSLLGFNAMITTNRNYNGGDSLWCSNIFSLIANGGQVK